MRKELTPLEALKKAKMDMDYHRKYECHYYYPKEEREEYFSIIETALKDYENHEQNEDFNKDVLNYAFLNEQDKIKKFKALEIIKKIICITSDDFFEETIGFKKVELTKEEFDLLKEVLL